MMDSASPRDMNRDRNRRGERQSRFSDAGGGSNSDRDRDRSHERRGGGSTNRIYVSNIPYEFRWQDLKDLCRELVGDVNFVELFNDENGKPRGCGIVEFKGNDCVAVAMEKMNRHEINGRHLVIKEDHGDQRDACGRVVRGGGGGGGLGGGNNGGGRDRDGGSGGNNNNNSSNRMSSGGGFNNRDRDDDRPRPLGGGGGLGLGNMGAGPGSNNNLGGGGGGGPMGDFDSPYNTYGLSTSFLEGLGIQGPLYNKIFIANLDYKVDAKKLKQVFKLAGRIVSVDLSSDKDGNSRGFAVVEYDHPVEAVQAISMFDRQTLFDRRMTVRLDRIPDKGESLKLPDGLKGVGIGLGPNGEPLKNVAYNLRNMNNNQAAPATPINNGGVNSVGVQNPSAAAAAAAASAAASLLGPAPNNALGGLNNLAAFNSVISNLSGTLGNPLTNPLLSSASLSSLGLSALANSASSGVNNAGSNDNQNNQQGGGGGGGGGGFNSSQGFQSAYSTPVFNTNLAALRSRNDYDQGNNNSNSVRSYSTQDYGIQRQGAFGNSVSSNNAFGNNNLNNNNNNSVSNQRKSDTVVIKNLPPSCNWQLLRDKFREMGEVKHAEMHSPDTGIVRFAAEKDAELAIKIMDGARFDNQTVYVSFF